MKKLFLSFATVILLVGFQACKQKPADDTAGTGSDSTMVEAPAVAVDTPAIPGDTSHRPATPPPDPIKKTP